MLAIFFEYPDLMMTFIERILERFTGAKYLVLMKFTSLNLYNRLLELYLVSRQKIKSEIEGKKSRKEDFSSLKI